MSLRPSRFARRAALAIAFAAAATPVAAAGYHLEGRIPIGGEGGWDLLTLDAGARRLYVTHSSRVNVVDVGRRALVGEIPDTRGVHGVALAPELGRGFASDGSDSTVTIFDLKSLGLISKIGIGSRNPDAILYESVTRRVLVFNGGSSNVTALDAASGGILGTLALGGKPELAVADGRGQVFVNLEDSSVVVGFDAATMTARSRWPLAPGEEPTGLAMDRDHHRLFAGCHNQLLVVLNADSGGVVASLPIGSGVDGVAFDPGAHLAFASNGDGTLTVIEEQDPDHFRVVANVLTQRGARTLALDEKTHRVYLAVAQLGPAPPATAEHPHPRPSIVPGTFEVLIFGR